MNKIAKSLAMIALVAAVAVGATTALFTDEETSIGNTFTAGTIDIAMGANGGENPWTSNYDLGDLKPGEVGYINFKISNVGENPVDVSKKLYNFEPTDSNSSGYWCTEAVSGGTSITEYYTSSEPECVAENGAPIDDVQNKILYDLSVEVYDGNNKIWWQTIYEVDGTDDKNLEDVYGDSTDGYNYVDLGMIPVGGYMLVTQSYHFNVEAGNEYQGDGLMFDMEILGEQLTGEDGMATVILEDKTLSGGAWVIDSVSDVQGILKYKTNGPEFVYEFSGKAPMANADYVLAIGLNDTSDVDTFVTEVTTGTGGVISTVSGSKELGADMMGVKAWLVPKANWTGAMSWNAGSGWPTMVEETLWETSFVWYNDTDETS